LAVIPLRRGLLTLWVWAGCGPSRDDTAAAPVQVVELVHADLWTAAADTEDPFPAHRSAAVECGAAGWYEETGGLEVDTGACPYFLGQLALPRDIRSGDLLTVDAWHSSLASEAPAEGHIALSVDGRVVWEHTEQIPGDANAWSDSFTAKFDAPEGALVVLHLHNHGYNTWNFHSFRLETSR
jgi:hypothetical protein